MLNQKWMPTFSRGCLSGKVLRPYQRKEMAVKIKEKYCQTHQPYLDQCSDEELSRFQTLNDAYKAKFDIPFIMAVRGSNRHKILEGFEDRLTNEPAVEFDRAIDEINRITMLRLMNFAASEYPRDLIGYGNQPPVAHGCSRCF